MKRITVADLALSFFLFLICGPGVCPAAEDSPDVRSLAGSNTAFALDLYSALKGEEGNLLFSPYSLSAALAMTFGGARGNTAAQMERTLHLALGPERLHAAFRQLSAEIKTMGSRGEVELEIADSLWPRKDHPFREAYLSLLYTDYGASAAPLDFGGAPEEARTAVNHWVEGRTHGAVREMIRPGEIDPSTVLVLVNAVRFRGEWAQAFDPSNTRPGEFRLEDGRTVRTDLMYRAGRFRLGETAGADLLEMPFVSGDLSMFVLLPPPGRGLHDVEDALEAGALTTELSNLSETEVGVWLPRFRMTWGTEDLSKALASMGMTDAFDPDRADFSGMDGTRSLFLSRVLHQASVEVNEAGAEAAGSTAVVVKKGGSEMRVFRADHPFLFLIRENTSGSLLFVGRLADPSLVGQ